ncbi:MAG: cyclomaltodextrinase C-terminal domain-containing protein, partial [Bacteroidales bacterium]|nr:cyclomaltodextrinase C-terminal domain-containing protein [Bacteroidales bacterium]
VTDEFPGFFIVGEVWYDDPAHTSYWALNKENSDGYRSNLPSLTDLPLCFSTHRAFSLPGANESMSDLYNLLSQDFLYPEPHRNVIFLDNHDMTRFFTETGKSLDNFKMGLSFILTTRGIPQIYYGTEIIMEGDKKRGDGYLREDFPGGWPGDKKNAFTGENMTTDEKSAYEFSRKLLNWRKGKEVIHTGRLKHYVPENGVYVYFRYDSEESVMVIINRSDEMRKLDTSRFAESLNGYASGTEITTGTVIKDLSSVEIPPRTPMIIELKK